LGQVGPRGEKEKRWVGLEKEKGREKEEGLESFFSNLFKFIFQTFEIELFFKL
jgi:hypothetical protein